MFEEQNQAANSVQEHQTRSEARLNAIQHDPNTFQKEPTGRPEDFEAWLLMFDVNQKRQEMERLLDSVDVIQEFYDKFVPLAVTHNEFWQRYFYRVRHSFLALVPSRSLPSNDEKLYQVERK